MFAGLEVSGAHVAVSWLGGSAVHEKRLLSERARAEVGEGFPFGAAMSDDSVEITKVSVLIIGL